MRETYSDRDILLGRLGYTSYADYLTSALWAGIRQSVYQLHGGKCRLCKCRAAVVHHTSYTRKVLSGKDLSKLVPLCDNCRHKVEFDSKDNKRCLEAAKTTFDRLANPKKGSRCNLCGNRIRKRGGACRACNGTGRIHFPPSHKATAYLAGKDRPGT